MPLIDKARRSLLSSLTILALSSCGPQSREPEQPAGRIAAFKQAATADPSPSKGDAPAGALPSQVVSGEVAAFAVTSTEAGVEKSRDVAGSLPSIAAAGKSAVYVPGERPDPP